MSSQVIVPHRIIALGALRLLVVVFLGPKEVTEVLEIFCGRFVADLWQKCGRFSPKKLRLEHPTFPSIQKTWFTYLESSDSGYSKYVLLVFVACVVKEISD